MRRVCGRGGIEVRRRTVDAGVTTVKFKIDEINSRQRSGTAIDQAYSQRARGRQTAFGFCF